MQSFQYCVPTQVLFGKGGETQVGEAVKAHGGSKVLVLFGSGSAEKSGLIGRVTASLEQSKLEFEVKGGVHANPLLSFVHETVEDCKGKGFDFLLAVGGGSVLDTAKAVGMGLGNPDIDVWEFFKGSADPMASLPIGSVLTIAAAGSETSDSAVITKDDTKEKRGRNTPFNRPRFAVMNPELTMTLPVRQTACGVADIIMHTLDRYFSSVVEGNATTDALAEGILKTTMTYGEIALENPTDYEARSEVMWCGSLSHNDLTGLGRMKDFSVHQLGHEVSGRFDMPHGESLTIMWGAWARFVCSQNYARFAKYARNVFGVVEADDAKAAAMGIEATVEYFKSLNMPTTFSESVVGLMKDEDIEVMAAGCSRGRSREVGSFRPINHDEMVAIYHSINH